MDAVIMEGKAFEEYRQRLGEHLEEHKKLISGSQNSVQNFIIGYISADERHMFTGEQIGKLFDLAN